MKLISKKELFKILKAHILWLETDGEKGKQADLKGAKLNSSNLEGAKLAFSILENANKNGFKDDIVKQSQVIKKICDETAKKIIKKNTSYGGSLFKENPMLKGEDPEKVIKAEIGHKINRLIFGNNDYDENDLEDLKGYIILLEVYKKLQENENENI